MHYFGSVSVSIPLALIFEFLQYRLLQYLKLSISVIFIAAVLIALSAVSLGKSLNGLNVSNGLLKYLKFGDMIGALQNERAMACIFLSAKE